MNKIGAYDMVNAHEIERVLRQFEEETEGVKGSCVVYSPQALVLAEASQEFPRDIVQAMSERILSLADQTLASLLKGQYKLKRVLIEEENHNIVLLPINAEYHLVIITTQEETKGLLMLNAKQLLNRIKPLLE